MRRWAKLNERQMATLRRIVEGESVTAKDSDLARTVYALRDRGLVSTPRENGIWTAEVTEAGRFYLEHGNYQGAAALTSLTVSSKSGRRTAGLGPQSPQALAADLIKRLQDEGGTLHVHDPDKATRALYRRALDAAKRHGLIPDGFRLLHTGRDRGDLILRLEDAAHPDETDARGHRYALNIKEELDRVPHVFTEEELRSRQLYPWQRITPEYDEVPSGRLRLELGEGPGLQHWADDKRSRLEDKMRAAVKEIERRSEADQQAYLARENAERERAENRRREEAARQAERDKELAQAVAAAQGTAAGVDRGGEILRRGEHEVRHVHSAVPGWVVDVAGQMLALVNRLCARAGFQVAGLACGSKRSGSGARPASCAQFR
jgi:hypothetical protein